MKRRTGSLVVLLIVFLTGTPSAGAQAAFQTPQQASPNSSTAGIRINEFLASNRDGLEDEDGDSADWIELYNPGPGAVNLAGWSLTDNPDVPRKWVFPEVILEEGAYLVIFASDKDRRPTELDGELHTNFRLGAEGEYLALYNATEAVQWVDGFAPRFPVQVTDVSFGRQNDAGEFSYFAQPTPGESNVDAEIVQLNAELKLSITSPDEDEVVDGRVRIKGRADAPGFLKWQLDFLPYGNMGQAGYLAHGNTPQPVKTTLLRLDTRDIPDGRHAVRLRVVRLDGNYDEVIVSFVVANVSEPEALFGLENRSHLSVPQEGDGVGDTIDVRGLANDPDFARWELYLMPGGDDSARIWIASGIEAGELSVSLDTTQFPDGEYMLNLRVVRSDANYEEVSTKFTVANQSS